MLLIKFNFITELDTEKFVSNWYRYIPVFIDSEVY